MIDQDCWIILYAPDLGPLRKETKELKSQKGGLNIACQERRLMLKCPRLDGRQHKMCKGKAEFA